MPDGRACLAHITSIPWPLTGLVCLPVQDCLHAQVTLSDPVHPNRGISSVWALSLTG
jgi:hypothetical protein